MKRNEQSLQELWDYVKKPNQCLIGIPECNGENESKLENTLQDTIQKNFPDITRQANIQTQEIQKTPQRYSSRRATPRHTVVRSIRVEMKEKILKGSQRERLSYPQRKDHHSQRISRQKPCKLEGSGDQYSTSLKKRTCKPEFHIWPN